MDRRMKAHFRRQNEERFRDPHYRHHMGEDRAGK